MCEAEGKVSEVVLFRHTKHYIIMCFAFSKEHFLIWSIARICGPSVWHMACLMLHHRQRQAFTHSSMEEIRQWSGGGGVSGTGWAEWRTGERGMLASPRTGSSCSDRSRWRHERGGRHRPLRRPEPRRVAPVPHRQNSWARARETVSVVFSWVC